MSEIFNIATYYMQGKPVYPAVRRLLNLLFNICISSFLYEAFFGKYYWFNYNDYRAILDFFIKGRFFIPFSIFIVVYSITQFVGVVSFIFLGHFKSIQLQRKILSYPFKNDEFGEDLKNLESASKFVAPVDLTPELMIAAYHEIRKDIKPEVFSEIELSMKEPRQNAEEYYILAFRGLVAITFFKISLPTFHWTLYLITVMVLLGVMIFSLIMFRICDIIPTILRKYHSEAENYIKDQLEQQKEITGSGKQ